MKPVWTEQWNTVDSRYLEFDGTMEKIRVNHSSTQEELWKYQKCSLFNDERETTRAKFWRAKTSIAYPDSRNDFKLIRCFCCCFFIIVIINIFFNENSFPINNSTDKMTNNSIDKTTNNSIDKTLLLCAFHNHWCMPTQAHLL